MAQQKSYSADLTIEQLIELAEQQKTVSEDDKITQVEQFILDLGVTEVDKLPRTEGPNIYWAYCKWCKANDRVPLKRIAFFKEFKKRFKICNSTKGVKTFWVDPTPFELEQDEWWQMRRALRREPNYKKKNPSK